MKTNDISTVLSEKPGVSRVFSLERKKGEFGAKSNCNCYCQPRRGTEKTTTRKNLDVDLTMEGEKAFLVDVASSGLLKSELLYLQEFESMEHFKLGLNAYLDYYNNQRIKAKPKGLPPAFHR